jgi:hypothetical protein
MDYGPKYCIIFLKFAEIKSEAVSPPHSIVIMLNNVLLNLIIVIVDYQ